MRVAIVTESFLPALNGVTTSVCHVAQELMELGHHVEILAPDPAPTSYRGLRVHGVTSLPVRQFQVGLPIPRVADLLWRIAPDVVHVASPFFLGKRALTAARGMGIPTVAVYQTDMASYVGQHRGPFSTALAACTWRYVRQVHSFADVTLAPSRAAMDDLERAGVPRVRRWGRGVDVPLFHPDWREDAGARALRRAVAPNGELVIGYVGRLAPEKELWRLCALASLPGTRLMITGDGPSSAELRSLLPGAVFLGARSGDDVARAYAACDVFVHPGTKETFGQTLQEASAMGLPVVAPAAGGPLDLVTHGVNGLLFDPSSETDLRRCVESLTVAEDAWSRRAVLGEAARVAVAGRTWAAVVKQLVAHYEDVRLMARLSATAWAA